MFTDEQLDLLRSRFDVPVGMNDTDAQIRWKAAQRDVVKQVEHMMQEQEQAEQFPEAKYQQRKGPQYKD
jgi:phage tail tube protein FII